MRADNAYTVLSAACPAAGSLGTAAQHCTAEGHRLGMHPKLCSPRVLGAHCSIPSHSTGSTLLHPCTVKVPLLPGAAQCALCSCGPWDLGFIFRLLVQSVSALL